MKIDGKFKTLAELRGYSTIDITSKSLDEILSYVDTMKEKYGESLNFPIKEGVIILKDVFIGDTVPDFFKGSNFKNCIYFTIEDIEPNFKMHIEAYLYESISGTTIGTCAANLDLNTKTTKITQLNYKEELKNSFIEAALDESRAKIPKSVANESCMLAMYSLLYVSLIQANRDTIYKESAGMKYKSDPTKKKITSKTKKVQVLNDDKVAYVFTGTNEAMKSFREYKRHTESWDVIGHPRHYKSGLIKWIAGFTKGKGRKDPKNYIVK